MTIEEIQAAIAPAFPGATVDCVRIVEDEHGFTVEARVQPGDRRLRPSRIHGDVKPTRAAAISSIVEASEFWAKVVGR